MAGGPVVKISIFTAARNAIRGLHQTAEAAERVGRRIKRGLTVVAGIGAAGLAAGAYALSRLFDGALEGAMEARRVTDVLSSQVKNLSSAGRGAFAGAAEFAAKWGNQIGEDDDRVKAVLAKLASFPDAFKAGSLGADAMKRATKGAFDLEAIGIGSAESNIVSIGKALNNPIKGMTALNKSGVSFSEEQKRQIAAYVKQGKLAEAQAVLLKGIESNARGAAIAATSPIKRMKATIDNLKEGVALAFLPSLSKVADKLNDFAPQIAKSLDPLVAKTADIFGDVVAKIIPFVPKVIDALGPLSTKVSKVFRGAFDVIPEVVKTLEPFFGMTLDVIKVFVARLPAVWSAVQPILASVGRIFDTAFTALLGIVAGLFDSFTAELPGIVSGLQPLAKAVEDMVTAVLPLLPPLIDRLVPLIPLAAALVAVLGSALATALTVATPLLVDLLGLLDNPAFTVFAGTVLVTVAAVKTYNRVMAIHSTVTRILASEKLLLRKAWLLERAAVIRNTAALVAHRATVIAVTTATRIWAGVQWLLNISMYANPIIGIIAAIVLLIGVIVLIATKTDWFQRSWRMTWFAVKKVFAFVVDWIRKGIQTWLANVRGIWGGIMSLVDTVVRFRDRVISTLVGWYEWMMALPGKIIDGLVRGFKAGWKRVTDFFDDAIGMIPSGIRQALGISSPSRVMAKIGENITRGLAVGIRKDVPLVRKAMDLVGRTVSGAAFDGVRVGQLDIERGGLAGAAAGIGPTYAITVNVPPAADPAEVGRQTVAAIEAFERRAGRQRLVPA